MTRDTAPASQARGRIFEVRTTTAGREHDGDYGSKTKRR
jgi:hypothetical protein